MALPRYFHGTSTAQKRKKKRKKIIGASVNIGWESQCLPYAGFFSACLYIDRDETVKHKFGPKQENSIFVNVTLGSFPHTKKCKKEGDYKYKLYIAKFYLHKGVHLVLKI